MIQSVIDYDSIEEKYRFDNLLGFKGLKHLNTGLKVNFANVAGPLFTMSVIVPVKFFNFHIAFIILFRLFSMITKERLTLWNI